MSLTHLEEIVLHMKPGSIPASFKTSQVHQGRIDQLVGSRINRTVLKTLCCTNHSGAM